MFNVKKTPQKIHIKIEIIKDYYTFIDRLPVLAGCYYLYEVDPDMWLT